MGISTAIRRWNLRVRPERASFLSSNFASSVSVRLNALITLIPLSFSLMKRLTESTSFCLFLKMGITYLITSAAISAIMGITAKMIVASLGLRTNDITTPPRSIMGTEIIIRRDVSTKSWITLTSLVQRVMREGVPILSISLCDKDSTLRKISLRRSLP